MTWITLWRPPRHYKNKEQNWDEVLENEVHVFIDKAKPKGVSVKGMCKLYFDWKKNRYYEKINNIDCYAYDFEKVFQVLGNKTITSINEPEEIKITVDEIPELPF